MKFTKFIPAVLALMLAAPAFASPVASVNDELQFEISPFFAITKNAQTLSATTTVDDTYSNLTLTSMKTGYHVITNSRTDNAYLTAECNIEGSGTANALYGTDNASKLYLVFTNEDALPASGSVTNITGGSAAKKDNPNAIAIELKPTVKVVANSGSSSADPTGALSGGVVAYTFSNGEYNFDYVLDTKNVANTFSTHDTEGTYKSTVYFTHESP